MLIFAYLGEPRRISKKEGRPEFPLNGLSSPRAPLKTLTEVLPLVRSGSFME
jgi:hypothetical protein